MGEALPAPGSEAALARRWEAGLRKPLRLEDGRALKVIFPGVPGGSSGPDFTGAILDAGGDYLRGDVEIHLKASGWRAHGHASDPAYGGVVLHVAGENDGGTVTTLHDSGRAIPLLVLRLSGRAAFPPPFTPPCAFAVAAGLDPVPALERMGLRRLRMKAARVRPLVASDGPSQALYTLLLETLAGPANRAAFASLARAMPLAALLERTADGVRSTPDRVLAVTAELRGAAAGLALRRAGLRPAAAPARRIEAAARLVARLWPGDDGEQPLLEPDGRRLPRQLKVEGIGRDMAVELAVNAVLPVALATGAWSDEQAAAVLRSLPAPAVYGRLKPLAGWLTGEAAPFPWAGRLQGGLMLHAEYCTRGACGRCPIDEVPSS